MKKSKKSPRGGIRSCPEIWEIEIGFPAFAFILEHDPATSGVPKRCEFGFDDESLFTTPIREDRVVCSQYEISRIIEVCHMAFNQMLFCHVYLACITTAFHIPGSAYGQSPSESGRSATPGRELAISLFSGMSERWINSGYLDCRLELTESEQAGKEILVPLSEQIARVLICPEVEYCAFGSIRKTWKFEDAMEGELEGEMDPRFSFVKGGEIRVNLLAGNGIRSQRVDSFEKSLAIACVPNFYALTTGRFPIALKDSSFEIGELEKSFVQAGLWDVALMPDTENYRIEAVVEFENSIEKRVWVVSAEHLLCRSYEHSLKHGDNKQVLKLYHHRVRWVPNAVGEMFPDTIVAYQSRVRKRPDLNDSKHYLSYTETRCKFGWTFTEAEFQFEQIEAPKQVVKNVPELKDFIR